MSLKLYMVYSNEAKRIYSIHDIVFTTIEFPHACDVHERDKQGNDKLKTSGLGMNNAKPVAVAAKSTKSKWPQKKIVVISDTANLQLLLKELVRSFGWTIIDTLATADQAIEQVNFGKANLIIVDDTVDNPAASRLRSLNSDPIACVTPTLVFLLDAHSSEKEGLDNLKHNVIVQKPLTPSKFIPAFNKLVSMWELQQYVALRMAIHQSVKFGGEIGQKTMKKLVVIDSILPLVAQNLSLEFRKQGKLVEAEKMLLQTLKKNPTSLRIMLALGELYMHASMPKMAMRIFNGARNRYGNSLSILPDLVQAYLLLDKYEEALECMIIMKKKNFQEENTNDFLTRIFLAAGKNRDAEKLHANKGNKFKGIMGLWIEAAEDPSIITAS